MKLLILSDSHGNVSVMEQIVSREQPDHVLHLGDCVEDARALEHRISVPLTLVKGNCDFGSTAPDILTPQFGGRKIFMTHGHLHGVKLHYQKILYAAQEAQAEILLFGHTHHAECFEKQGIWVLNPGSIGRRGTYGVIDLFSKEFFCRIERI